MTERGEKINKPLFAFVAYALLAGITGPGAAQNPDAAQRFRSAGPEHTGEAHVILRQPGQAVLLTMTQFGRDLQIELIDDIGRRVGLVGFPGRSFGKEFVLIDRDSPAVAARVLPERASSIGGEYAIEFTAIQPDDPQFGALSKLTRGGILFARKKDESIAEALKLFREVVGPTALGHYARYYAAAGESYFSSRRRALDLIGDDAPWDHTDDSDLALLWLELAARSWLFIDFEKSELRFAELVERLTKRLSNGDAHLQVELVSAREYQCILQYYQKRFDDVDICDSNLADARRLGDPGAIGWAYNNLAALHAEQGIEDEGIRYSILAEEQFQLAGMPSYVGLALSWRAQLEMQSGRYAAARGLIVEALDILRVRGRNVHRGTAWRRAAELYTTLGDYDLATDYASQAIRVYQTNADQELEARSYRLLAEAHVGAGQLTEALDAIESALNYYAAATGKESERAAVQMQQALIYARQRDTQRALDIAATAMAAPEVFGSTLAQANAYLTHARIFLLARAPQAQRLAQDALDIYKKENSTAGQIESLLLLTRYWHSLGRHSEALRVARQAEALLTQFAESPDLARLAPVFRGKVFDLYGLLVDSILNDAQLARSDRFQTALGVVLDAHQPSREQRLQLDSTALAKSRREVNEAMEERFTGNAGDKSDAAVLRALESHEQAMADATIATEPTSLGLSADAFIEQVASDELLLAPIWSEHSGWLISVTAASIDARPLPTMTDLWELIRSALDDPVPQRGIRIEPLMELSRQLVPRIPESVNRITVIPNGAFQFLPLGILSRRLDLYDPLGIHFEIAYSTTPSLAGTHAIDISRGVAVIANPAYSRAEVGQDSGIRAFSGRLTPLPWTAAEADRIVEHFAPIAPVTQRLWHRANKSALTERAVLEHAIIHVAAHGFFTSELGGHSGLVFSNIDEQQRPVSALFSVADARLIDTDAKLIVLNGCETALGDYLRGAGIIGMTSAFHDAGIPHAVGTMWKVADQSAMEFMDGFYAQLVQNGDIGAAIRFAKHDLFTNHPNFRNPFFWGAYIHHRRD